MATRITISLSDDQALGLIQLAAAGSMTAEECLLYVLDGAIIDADLLPVQSLEDVLRDIAENPPPRPSRRRQMR